MQTMNNKPDIIQWVDMPSDIQETILNSHARHYKTSNTDGLRKAFNAGNPLIIFGFENKKLFTQIHPQSTAIMQVLIKQNL